VPVAQERSVRLFHLVACGTGPRLIFSASRCFLANLDGTQDRPLLNATFVRTVRLNENAMDHDDNGRHELDGAGMGPPAIGRSKPIPVAALPGPMGPFLFPS